MPASNLPLLTGASLFIDTANGSGTSLAGTTIKSSSTVVYEIELDNTANAAATYTRLHNATSQTVGTTVPDALHMTPASTKVTLVYPVGVTFGTGLGCSSGTSATLATTTAPSSSFILRVVYV